MTYGACDAADAKYPARITYIIDENGLVTHALPKVDPKSHTDDVLRMVA